MIKVGNTLYRNLEEQVQFLTDYHDVNQGLVQWGIRVVGKVASENELPDPATYDGEYGDAFAVGTSSPYSFGPEKALKASPLIGSLLDQ